MIDDDGEYRGMNAIIEDFSTCRDVINKEAWNAMDHLLNDVFYFLFGMEESFESGQVKLCYVED